MARYLFGVVSLSCLSLVSMGAYADALLDALVVCPPGPIRFVDNGDGTICDHQTGLMWEQKDASDSTADPDNPHDVDNPYDWSSTGSDPDGKAFTEFLPRLNGAIAGTAPSEQLGGYHDWRLPTIAELQTILDPVCSSGAPCILDPVFAPTAEAGPWSSTSHAAIPSFAWAASFISGSVADPIKNLNFAVRAVRGGL